MIFCMRVLAGQLGHLKLQLLELLEDAEPGAHDPVPQLHQDGGVVAAQPVCITPKALLPSAHELVKSPFIALLAFHDKQLIVYLGPALSHSPIMKVGRAARNVPYFQRTEPNLWPGPTV